MRTVQSKPASRSRAASRLPCSTTSTPVASPCSVTSRPSRLTRVRAAGVPAFTWTTCTLPCWSWLVPSSGPSGSAFARVVDSIVATSRRLPRPVVASRLRRRWLCWSWAGGTCGAGMVPSRGGESSEAPVPPSSLPSKVSPHAGHGKGCGTMGRMASDEQQSGLVFPVDEEGRRSTSSVGRLVVADALRATDPTGAGRRSRRPAGAPTTWCTSAGWSRRGWSRREAAVSIAGRGLDSLHERMQVAGRGRPGALARRVGRRGGSRSGPRGRRGARPGRAGRRAGAALPRRPAAGRRHPSPRRRLGRRGRGRADRRRRGRGGARQPGLAAARGTHRRRARRGRRDGAAARR